MRETEIIAALTLAAATGFFVFLKLVTKIAEANERGLI